MELVELLYFSLLELGCEAMISPNRIITGSTNIVIGCHLLDPALTGSLPADTVLLNTEQVCDDDKSWNDNIFRWFGAGYQVWDYSQRNIERFLSLGVANVRKLNLGFQKELVRIPKDVAKDIDVLFYGALNRRRVLILEKLQKAGLRVETLFGVYAGKRDQWVARSKVVLNLHYHRSQIFEVVRVFYLLTNSVAVVGEVNPATSIEPDFRRGIIPSPYEELVERTVEVARDDRMRMQYEEGAFAAIARRPPKRIHQGSALGRGPAPPADIRPQMKRPCLNARHGLFCARFKVQRGGRPRPSPVPKRRPPWG